MPSVTVSPPNPTVWPLSAEGHAVALRVPTHGSHRTSTCRVLMGSDLSLSTLWWDVPAVHEDGVHISRCGTRINSRSFQTLFSLLYSVQILCFVTKGKFSNPPISVAPA